MLSPIPFSACSDSYSFWPLWLALGQACQCRGISLERESNVHSQTCQKLESSAQAWPGSPQEGTPIFGAGKAGLANMTDRNFTWTIKAELVDTGNIHSIGLRTGDCFSLHRRNEWKLSQLLCCIWKTSRREAKGYLQWQRVLCGSANMPSSREWAGLLQGDQKNPLDGADYT